MIDTLLGILTHPLFVFVTFVGVALHALGLALARAVRFRYIQRDKPLLFFIVNNLAMATAFAIGALLSAPHPYVDFSFLIPWARASWGLFLISFAISVHWEWWMLRLVLKKRQGAGK